MKNSKALFWTVTGLMAAFMMFASIPDILQLEQAASIFAHLGYPHFLMPFLGIAKALGVVVILLPGVPRLKEWAFAGLVIDLVGALYSHLSVGDGPGVWMAPVIGLLLVSGAYYMFRLTQSGPGVAVPSALTIPAATARTDIA